MKHWNSSNRLTEICDIMRFKWEVEEFQFLRETFLSKCHTEHQ